MSGDGWDANGWGHSWLDWYGECGHELGEPLNDIRVGNVVVVQLPSDFCFLLLITTCGIIPWFIGGGEAQANALNDTI